MIFYDISKWFKSSIPPFIPSIGAHLRSIIQLPVSATEESPSLGITGRVFEILEILKLDLSEGSFDQNQQKRKVSCIVHTSSGVRNFLFLGAGCRQFYRVNFVSLCFSSIFPLIFTSHRKIEQRDEFVIYIIKFLFPILLHKAVR